MYSSWTVKCNNLSWVRLFYPVERLEHSLVWMDNNNKPPEPNLNIQDESNKTSHAKEGELVLFDLWNVSLILRCDLNKLIYLLNSRKKVYNNYFNMLKQINSLCHKSVWDKMV